FLKNDIFFVINCDILFDIDFRHLKDFHMRSKALSTLALRKDPEQEKFGIIETDTGSRITRFLGKPAGAKNSVLKYMFSGIHVMSPEIFGIIKPEYSNICRDVYPGLVESGSLAGYESGGYWIDIGTPANLFRANKDILHNGNPRWINDLLPLPSSAVRYTGKGSVVPASAKISGTVIVADNCVIGDNCLLRDCMIFPGTKIPSGSEVTNCVRGNDFSARI
ncbi:MAG: NDP-sugar synthase, partial [bacterium]|nr:NDP-sugar synthase [bacterium]